MDKRREGKREKKEKEGREKKKEKRTMGKRKKDRWKGGEGQKTLELRQIGGWSGNRNKANRIGNLMGI